MNDIRFLMLLFAGLLVVGQAGCVQRRMTILSNPPGALVEVDNVPIGKTPVSHDFLYYGTREIRLVKDGYETLVAKQPMVAPWYQVPPFDFFSDNFAGREIRDERVLSYQLIPHRTVPTDEILIRAEDLRLTSTAPPSTLPPSIVTRPSVVPPLATPLPTIEQQPLVTPPQVRPPGRRERIWPVP